MSGMEAILVSRLSRMEREFTLELEAGQGERGATNYVGVYGGRDTAGGAVLSVLG